MEWGGIKKDIALLIISGIALILSLTGAVSLPFDIAWVAIVLCGVPIILEAIIGLITAFDIKADVLVSLALIAAVCIGEDFAAGEVAFSNPVEVVDFAGNSETRATTLCTAVTFSRTETPQGKPVTVLYSKADGLEAKGDPASSDAAGGTSSVRVPVQIIENDVTYNLVRISAK